MGNEIKFVVLGDVKDLETKLAKAQKGFSTMEKISVAAFAGLTASAYGFIQAARQQEESINSLNQTLQNQGNFSEEASKDLQKYASALQEVSLFGDETIIKAESLIASFGFEGETLKQLTKATLDLAQAKGMDLTSAADLVAKSVGSSTNILARYGITIEGVAGSSARASSAIEGLNRLYGGQAEAATKGLGSITVLKNAMSDLSEEIGNKLSPTVVGIISKLKLLADLLKSDNRFAQFAADMLILGIQVTATGIAIGLLGLAFIKARLAVELLNTSTISLVGKSISLGSALGWVAGIGIAAFVGWKVGELISDVTGLTDAVKRLGTSLGEIKAQQTLGADYISEAEFESARKGWEGRKKLLDEEAAYKEQQRQDQVQKLNETTQFITGNAEQLKTISATQTQADLDDLILKLDMERQAKIQDLEMKQQILADAGVLEVAKQEEIRSQIKAINDQYDALEVMARQQKQNKMNEIEKKGYDLYKQVSQNKLETLQDTLQQAAQLDSKFANAYKIIAMGRVVMYSALAIMRAFAENNFWEALGISALIASQSAVQLANISSQSFAMGTPEIPQDMVANVHKGETIIPESFADSIRSGDLTLSGPGSEGGSGMIFNFYGNLNGITETFVRDIFTRASEAINNRTLSPLPAV